MNATLLSGTALAKLKHAELATQITQLQQTRQITPCLAVILVGGDAASTIYVARKREACQTVGIQSIAHHLPENTTQIALEALIEDLNQDATVDGILVQLPLPKPLDASRVINLISPEKDVDGFHPYNIGMLALREPGIRPCTPHGIMNLLKHHGIDVKGMDATVIGSSNIVGRPMMLELLHAGATVSICHRFTKDISHYVRQADLLVSATGVPGLIKSEWIKPGAVVVDVGITRREDGTLTGDIDFDTAVTRASYITPVPGGVGPMTVVTLLENTLQACLHRRG